MSNNIKIELTEEERGIICTALDFWSDNNEYITEETYNQTIELIERIANAF